MTKPNLCPGTHLYLSSLAERLEVLEADEHAANDVARRLYRRRLRAGMAFHADDLLAERLGHYAVVRELLAQRHFERHGRYAGATGARAAKVAARLFQRLMAY